MLTRCTLLLLAAHLSAQDADLSEDCQLQEEWRGEYFKSGDRGTFLVTRQSFGVEGSCYRKQSSNVYILFNRDQRCFRCVQIWERHKNALEYQLGPCDKFENPDELSCDIDTTSNNSTIVRLNGESTPCPFKGKFSFTYKEDGKECNTPKSFLSQCIDQSQYLFRFGVCSKSIQTEDSGNSFYQAVMSLGGDPEEKLTCKATWTREDDPSEVYMIGTMDYRYKRTDEERVRCFLIKETKRWVQVAQSENSSCYGDLHSSSAGYRTMKLVKEETEDSPRCLFPDWAVEMGTLYSFGFSSQYSFSEDGTILSASNYSSSTSRSHELSRTECISINSTDEYSSKLIVRTDAGCQQMYKCLRIFKRTDDILEIQEGSPTIFEEAACTAVNFNDRFTTFTTLFRDGLQQVDCPINGLHNVTGLDLAGKTEPCENQGFTHVNIRCGDEEHFIQFHQQCLPDDELSEDELEAVPKSNYICLGGWEKTMSLEEYYSPRRYSEMRYNPGWTDMDSTNITVGYLVAAQALTMHQRICFIYTRINETYAWTVDKTSCLRNIRPGIDGRMKFNTTLIETCAAFTLRQSMQTIALLLALYSIPRLV